MATQATSYNQPATRPHCTNLQKHSTVDYSNSGNKRNSVRSHALVRLVIAWQTIKSDSIPGLGVQIFGTNSRSKNLYVLWS